MWSSPISISRHKKKKKNPADFSSVAGPNPKLKSTMSTLYDMHKYTGNLPVDRTLFYRSLYPAYSVVVSLRRSAHTASIWQYLRGESWSQHFITVIAAASFISEGRDPPDPGTRSGGRREWLLLIYRSPGKWRRNRDSDAVCLMWRWQWSSNDRDRLPVVRVHAVMAAREALSAIKNLRVYRNIGLIYGQCAPCFKIWCKRTIYLK